MKIWVYGCNSLISLPDISKWKTANVTNINYIFQSCNSLVSLPDISKWDSINILNKEKVFDQCLNLLNIIIPNEKDKSKIEKND